MNIWIEVFLLTLVGFYLGWISAALFVSKRNAEDISEAFHEGKVQAWYEAALAFGVTPPDAKEVEVIRRVK